MSIMAHNFNLYIMILENFIAQNSPDKLKLSVYSPYNRYYGDTTKYYIITNQYDEDIFGEYLNYNDALYTLAYLRLENLNDFKNLVLNRVKKLYSISVYNSSLSHRTENLKKSLDLCKNIFTKALK